MDLEILRIASEDNNNKYIQNHTHHSKLKNPLCGDEMQINLIINNEERIIDFGYQGKCCVYCQASASLLSKISINKKKSKINELCDDAKSFFDGNSDIIKKKWKLMQKIFKSKNKARKECILLPFKTVQKIVSD